MTNYFQFSHRRCDTSNPQRGQELGGGRGGWEGVERKETGKKKVSSRLRLFSISISSLLRRLFLPSIRSRDRALSALARSSKSGHTRWLPHLLQTVTVSLDDLHCLYYLLERDAPQGLFVKSLNIIPIPENASPEDGAFFEELWARLGIAVGREVTQNEAEIMMVLVFVLEKCRNLRPPDSRPQRQLLPLPSHGAERGSIHLLTHSLKRLFLRGSEDPKNRSNVQNMIWILVYCPHLRHASLSFIPTLGAGFIPSGISSGTQISIDCLSSLSNSYSSIKHLRLINLIPTQSTKTDLSASSKLKILSLDCYALREMKEGDLGSWLSSVKVFTHSILQVQLVSTQGPRLRRREIAFRYPFN